jgi:tetratricopeptide (TPR) repeat protein
MYLEGALAVAHQQGDPAQIATLTSYRCELDFYQGAWERAWMDGERALRMGRERGPSWSLGHVLVHHAQLCLATCSQATARGHLEEMLSIPGHGASVRRPAHRLLAECDILEGQPQAARARLLPLLDRPGLEEWDVTALLPILAWAHLDLGDSALAEDTLTQAFRRARAGNHRLALAEALRVQALLALRQERWVEAERALDEGLALAEQMPYPYAEGRLLHLYGRMHGRKGEPGPARERLEAALRIFQRLGASRDIEHVQQDLATLLG